MNIFEYSSLSSQKSPITQAFHDKGIIAIRGVPGFDKAYEDFLNASRQFISLTEEQQAKYTPEDAYSRGWSYGIETFNGVRDAFKGSYYAAYPEKVAHAPNIWPTQDVPEFQHAYLNLVKIIFNMGKEVLPLINIAIKNNFSVTRMLYYGPVDNPKAVEWCGEHRDHGLITGLCPGTYFLNGKKVLQPPKTGLFVRGEEVSVSNDVLLFQIGEVAELITNGAVTATEHEVRKAIGGYERYNLAVFLVPSFTYKIKSTLTKYNDRFSPGMSFADWNDRSYAKYNDV
jgi:isopenicillin N synthase-like dioxygenase